MPRRWLPRAKAMVLRRPAARHRPVAHLSDPALSVTSPGEVAQPIDGPHQSCIESGLPLVEIAFILPSRIQWGPPDPSTRPTLTTTSAIIATFGCRLHAARTQYEIFGTQVALIERLEAQANLHAVEDWYRRYFQEAFVAFENAHLAHPPSYLRGVSSRSSPAQH